MCGCVGVCLCVCWVSQRCTKGAQDSGFILQPGHTPVPTHSHKHKARARVDSRSNFDLESTHVCVSVSVSVSVSVCVLGEPEVHQRSSGVRTLDSFCNLGTHHSNTQCHSHRAVLCTERTVHRTAMLSARSVADEKARKLREAADRLAPPNPKSD